MIITHAGGDKQSLAVSRHAKKRNEINRTKIAVSQRNSLPAQGLCTLIPSAIFPKSSNACA